MNNVSGGGTLIVAGSMGAQEAAVLSAGGSFAVVQSKGGKETAVLTGGGSLVAVASKGARGDAVGTGIGSVVVAVSKAALGAPSVSGNGTVVVAGVAGARKAALIHGGGIAVAQGWKGAKAAADLSGGGAIVITYVRMGGSIHSAYLPGGGDLVAAAVKGARAPPAIHGRGRIDANGVKFYAVVGGIRTPVKYEPIRLVYLHLDYCGNVFGTDPCLATGTPCFNTWKTCKDLSAFNNIGKTYKYSEVDATLPFKGVRPYVKSVKLLPTEIKTNLTVNARVSVTMVDEMDQDIDTDPYLGGPGKI